jgi:hypothetical protein
MPQTDKYVKIIYQIFLLKTSRKKYHKSYYYQKLHGVQILYQFREVIFKSPCYEVHNYESWLEENTKTLY